MVHIKKLTGYVSDDSSDEDGQGLLGPSSIQVDVVPGPSTSKVRKKSTWIHSKFLYERQREA